MNYENLLSNIICSSEKILKNNLVGIYLHGSATMGCFNPKKSDLDLIFVVEDDIPDVVKMQFMNKIIELNEDSPAKGIELSIVKREYCNPFVYPTPFELHFSGMHLNWFKENPDEYIEKMKGTDKDLAAHFTIINKFGNTLFGEPIAEVFGVVPKENYVDSIWSDIEDAGENIIENTMYITLNLCRVLAYLRESIVLSKKTGGEWGLKHLPDKYHDLIREALHSYETDKEMVSDTEIAVEFAEYMVSEIKTSGLMESYKENDDFQQPSLADSAINIPENIQQIIETTEYTSDTIGMSDSSVLLFADKVLKIEEDWYESENEYQVMKWLKDKLPVPEVICHEKLDGKSYLLMSKLTDKMLCDELYMDNPDLVVELLVKALKLLWQVDISDCPFDSGIDKKLKMAKYNLEHDKVDLDNVEPETFGEGGFENAEALLNWLIQNKPQEESVFTHGDFCLPNIFAKDDEIRGFIDWGRAGVADKYQDIAICYRSLKHNFEGKYGGEKHENFNPDILFEKLGIVPDWDKIKYYILLDELF